MLHITIYLITDMKFFCAQRGYCFKYVGFCFKSHKIYTCDRNSTPTVTPPSWAQISHTVSLMKRKFTVGTPCVDFTHSESDQWQFRLRLSAGTEYIALLLNNKVQARHMKQKWLIAVTETHPELQQTSMQMMVIAGSVVFTVHCR